MKEFSYNIKVSSFTYIYENVSRSRMVRVINYSGRQCFSLPDGASNKLFRTKIFKKVLSIDRIFFLKNIDEHIFSIVH